MPVKQIREAEFDSEVAQHQGRVIVDFYATWCPPCRALAPILDQLANQYPQTLTVVKVNADENPVTAAAYRALALPTMKVIQGGTVVGTIVGSKSKPALDAELSAYVTAAVSTG